MLHAGDAKAPAVVQLAWDPSGDQLAMLPSGNTFVLIWSAGGREPQKIDTDFKASLGACCAEQKEPPRAQHLQCFFCWCITSGVGFWV
jgi:hypothetical protein